MASGPCSWGTTIHPDHDHFRCHPRNNSSFSAWSRVLLQQLYALGWCSCLWSNDGNNSFPFIYLCVCYLILSAGVMLIKLSTGINGQKIIMRFGEDLRLYIATDLVGMETVSSAFLLGISFFLWPCFCRNSTTKWRALLMEGWICVWLVEAATEWLSSGRIDGSNSLLLLFFFLYYVDFISAIFFSWLTKRSV